jgi:CHAD domain-containing protein
MTASATTELPLQHHPTGLDFWMSAVQKQCDNFGHNFDPDSVHDLRVALRRCRSIADGFMLLDPHPAWKLMKKESKRLFRRLGALRDVQVMTGWAQQFTFVSEMDFSALHKFLGTQENVCRESAAQAVVDLNLKKWASWTRTLSKRTRNIPVEGDVFQHLALEHWMNVHTLHKDALRNRTHVGYHRLRIALKKFRYTVESFLPLRYEQWGADLKAVQDVLGEMHDLYVLWRTVLGTTVFPDKQTRMDWRQHLLGESSRRLQMYRERMLGKTSPLIQWRTGLPGIGQIRDVALSRFRVWASFRDPDVSHSKHVVKLALQIFDSLHTMNLLPFRKFPDARSLLGLAALARIVGYSKHHKRHHLASYRMIRKLRAPLGLSAEELRSIALIVRFHRGRLPRIEQKAFSGLTKGHRNALIVLSGILRLADALDPFEGRHIDEVQLSRSGDILMITLPRYSGNSVSAQKVAAARHLLEVACRLPILIR